MFNNYTDMMYDFDEMVDNFNINQMMNEKNCKRELVKYENTEC